MRRHTRRAGLLLFALMFTSLVALAHAAAASARPWLGVYTQEITGDLREGLDLRADAGVIVNRVVPDGPAANAGLKAGDVLVRFDGHDVESPQDLAHMVGEAREGQAVPVQVLRRGETRTLMVTLAARPDADDAPEPPAPPAPPALRGRDDSRSGDAHRDVRVKVYRHGDEDGDSDDSNDGDAHRDVRVKVYTHGDDSGPHSGRVRIYRNGEKPEEFRLDGDLQKLPAHVRGMLQDLPGLDGNGGLHALRVMGAGRGRLGVRIETLSEDLAGALGVPGENGVLVLEVMPDTPAQRAGMRAGDVILTVEGNDVKDAEGLVAALRDVDGKVSMTVSRKGARRTVEAELAAASHSTREAMPTPEAGRRGEVERQFRLRDRQGADVGDLREQVEELRQQLRDLRHQLEERDR